MRKMVIERPKGRYRTPKPTSTGQIVAHNTAGPPDERYRGRVYTNAAAPQRL
jgi:hypothetical protein